MGTLANSEDLDEMQHTAEYHEGLHCLLRLKQPSVTELSTCDPLKCIIGSSKLIVLMYGKIHQNTNY